MRFMVFAVYDSCSAIYDRPFVARSEAEAVRSFGDIAQDATHTIGQHPEHFSLYIVGQWDDNCGEMKGEPPKHVANAHELVAAKREIPTGSLKEVN